jgi:hypothetical protein
VSHWVVMAFDRGFGAPTRALAHPPRSLLIEQPSEGTTKGTS